MLRPPFELGLALRYLRPKGTPVSIITLICILGVMLGVAILIIVIAVMSGFGAQLRDSVLGFNAHLKVVRARAPLSDWRPLLDSLRAQPRVKGVAPFVFGQILVMTQSADTQRAPAGFGAFVRGIDPKHEASVSVLPNRIVEGEFDLRGDSVLVGIELAQQLGLHVGDKLAVASVNDLVRMTRGAREGENEMRPAANFYVRGIFDVGFHEYDATTLVTSLGNAQDFYDLDDAVHGLMLTLHDTNEAATELSRDELQTLIPTDCRIITWMEENQLILGAIAVEKDMMYFLLFFIMIVAAFCIICSQLAFVMQKTREIGVLKSLGAKTSQIVALFLAQSSAVGVIGVASGFAGGQLALHYRNDFLHAMRRLTGHQLFPAEIYNFRELPALIYPNDLAVICGVSLFMCLLAGFVPAWVAASMKPVEAMRHE